MRCRAIFSVSPINQLPTTAWSVSNLELYPNIIEANHACGLGASYDIIDRQISGKVVPFLNYEDWKHQITANTDE